jgi:hypothetical protein
MSKQSKYTWNFTTKKYSIYSSILRLPTGLDDSRSLKQHGAKQIGFPPTGNNSRARSIGERKLGWIHANPPVSKQWQPIHVCASCRSFVSPPSPAYFTSCAIRQHPLLSTRNWSLATRSVFLITSFKKKSNSIGLHQLPSSAKRLYFCSVHARKDNTVKAKLILISILAKKKTNMD